jgi:hypothetical protein
VESEYAAHQAALRMAFANGDREAVGFYLASLQGYVARGGNLGNAAQRVIDSSEYPRYREFAGLYFGKWVSRQILDDANATGNSTSAGPNPGTSPNSSDV